MRYRAAGSSLKKLIGPIGKSEMQCVRQGVGLGGVGTMGLQSAEVAIGSQS